ncbi:PGF-pre-PGF domain-containing protein, partial [Chloroflexota bacterium]
LLGSTSTSIGYATSSNATTWTVQSASDLTGSSSNLWSSVAAPTVIIDGTSHKMWHTVGIPALTWQNFLDVFTGDDLPIGYASYTPAATGGGGGIAVDGAPSAAELETMDADEAGEVLGELAEDDPEAAGEVLGELGEDDAEAAGDILSEVGDTDPGLGYILPSFYGTIDTEVAGEILEQVANNDAEVAGEILTEVADTDTEVAGEILEEVANNDAEVAGDILTEVADTDTGVAAEILEEVANNDAEVAGEILAEVADTEIAAGILEEVVNNNAEVAGEILGEMDAESAAAVMEESSTDTLTDVIPEMSEGALTDTLPGLSPDTLYSIDPEVLFESLPNAPTEQLLSEEPPEPPADAESPVVVYSTPSGARYLAVRTWAGEWVIVMGTPAPIDKLLIKTKQALTDVQTLLDIYDERPQGTAADLPDDQIASAYFTIRFQNAPAEDIELAHITFFVEQDWLEDNSLHKWSIALMRYDTGSQQWILLPTKRVSEDNTYVYYSATITNFSTFAISGSETLPSVNFSVHHLIVSPTEAGVGEPIVISANVRNLSDETATYVATLWVDGTIEAGQDIALEAGETKPVSFTVTRETVGNYEVRLDRLYESFSISTEAGVVEAEAPAAFVPSILTVSPSQVEPGEEIAVSVTVTNTGDLSGSYDVVLMIDNVVEATQAVTLAGHTSQTVTFAVQKEVVGNYSVTVDGLTKSFVVGTPVPPRPAVSYNWWAIGGAIIGVISLGIFIWWAIARRRVD